MLLSDFTVPSHLDHVLEEEVAKDLALTKKDIKINLRLYDCYETFLKLSLILCLRRIRDVRTFRILLLHFLSVMQSV